MNPEKVDKTTQALIFELETHIKQTHTHAYDVAFEAGYRLALCHFGGCLEDMKGNKDTGYNLARFQLCTRHEEMVDLINNTPVKEVISGKEGAWAKPEPDPQLCVCGQPRMAHIDAKGDIGRSWNPDVPCKQYEPAASLASLFG